MQMRPHQSAPPGRNFSRRFCAHIIASICFEHLKSSTDDSLIAAQLFAESYIYALGGKTKKRCGMGKLTRQERTKRQLKSAVEQISSVIARLYEAISMQRGVDCAPHAVLGRALLRDFNFESKLVAGYAAWAVGTASNAIISHVRQERGYSLPGTEAFNYHAWLQCEGHIIDLTTYQLRRKAQLLDAADGGYTEVTWSPSYLMLPPNRTLSYEKVRRSKLAGVVYYEPQPELLRRLESTATLALEPEELWCARRLLADPSLNITGPNTIIDAGISASAKLEMLRQFAEALGPENVPASIQRVAHHLREHPVPLTTQENAELDQLLASASVSQ